MIKFTNFQRRMWYWLTYFSVCRYYIDQDQQGNYMIKKVGGFRLFIYYSMWTNTIVKIIYLILTYRGYLIQIHFLDQMSIWDWLLCFSQLVQETNMWYRKNVKIHELQKMNKIFFILRPLSCALTQVQKISTL